MRHWRRLWSAVYFLILGNRSGIIGIFDVKKIVLCPSENFLLFLQFQPRVELFITVLLLIDVD